MKINRRQFGYRLAFLMGAANSKRIFAGNKNKSIVTMIKRKGLVRVNNDINFEYAGKAVDLSLKELTGEKSSSRAWQSIFRPNERVGIKVSCLPGKPLSSSIGLVHAITTGLMRAGIKGDNIYVWERTEREMKRAGFKIVSHPVNFLATDSLAGGGYTDRVEISGSIGSCFSRMVEIVDALISVPVLKDHDIAGVSIGMKNFYGAIHNPNKYHGNNCDPYVADLCNHPLIKNKLRLTVCDASRIQAHNGPAFSPGYTREMGTLLMSLDPVAIDFIGWNIIERMRSEMGLGSLKEEKREPAYLKTAEKLGLGQADPAKITVLEI